MLACAQVAAVTVHVSVAQLEAQELYADALGHHLECLHSAEVRVACINALVASPDSDMRC